jgi:hypothetical protein
MILGKNKHVQKLTEETRRGLGAENASGKLKNPMGHKEI